METLSVLGRASVFWWRAMVGAPDWRNGPGLLIRQLYFVGVYSLIIIIVSGVFIGMVLALQGYTVLVRFGADQALGQLVSLSLLRELGPVVAALLFAGRAGSALTAEIGLMKATEQLASMAMIGVDPLKRIRASAPVGGHDFDADTCADLQYGGDLGRGRGWCRLAACRRRFVLGEHAEARWSFARMWLTA